MYCLRCADNDQSRYGTDEHEHIAEGALCEYHQRQLAEDQAADMLTTERERRRLEPGESERVTKRGIGPGDPGYAQFYGLDKNYRLRCAECGAVWGLSHRRPCSCDAPVDRVAA
jgi:hypothetical protein